MSSDAGIETKEAAVELKDKEKEEREALIQS